MTDARSECSRVQKEESAQQNTKHSRIRTRAMTLQSHHSKLKSPTGSMCRQSSSRLHQPGCRSAAPPDARRRSPQHSGPPRQALRLVKSAVQAPVGAARQPCNALAHAVRKGGLLCCGSLAHCLPQLLLLLLLLLRASPAVQRHQGGQGHPNQQLQEHRGCAAGGILGRRSRTTCMGRARGCTAAQKWQRSRSNRVALRRPARALPPPSPSIAAGPAPPSAHAPQPPSPSLQH